MLKFELRTVFKTTLKKLKDNGWEITKGTYADAKWCVKKINNKGITTALYCDGCLYVSICDNFADLDMSIAICEELKKLEVKAVIKQLKENHYES